MFLLFQSRDFDNNLTSEMATGAPYKDEAQPFATGGNILSASVFFFFYKNIFILKLDHYQRLQRRFRWFLLDVNFNIYIFFKFLFDFLHQSRYWWRSYIGKWWCWCLWIYISSSFVCSRRTYISVFAMRLHKGLF